MSNTVDELILELLRGGVPEDLTVFDGEVTDSDEVEKTIGADLPYLVFYSTPGRGINARQDGLTRALAVGFQITFVGEDRHQAKWAAKKADDILHGARITIGDRERVVRRDDDDLYVRRDDTWTRPGGGPLFVGFRRYSTRT